MKKRNEGLNRVFAGDNTCKGEAWFDTYLKNNEDLLKPKGRNGSAKKAFSKLHPKD